MGGICINKEREPEAKDVPRKSQMKPQTQIQNVDLVKMKLKQARDRIKAFIGKKNKDIAKLDEEIKEKLPAYEATKNKKPLVPLLKAKKELMKAVEQGDTRLTLVNDKLAEVEMSQVNKETIDVLDDSNKYIKEVQEALEDKDWLGVLADAQNQYTIDWPDDSEEVQEDPAFQEMWAQLGGNKLPKTVEKKKVSVEVAQQQQEQQKMETA